MDFSQPARSRKLAVFTSIVLVLVAMMLPVCHLHPLLDKAAPDHCAICVSLHAAAPLSAHAPSLVAVIVFVERLATAPVQHHRIFAPSLIGSRAPPLKAC